MPLDSGIHFQPPPIHSQNSQPQNMANPSIRDSNSAKPGQQHSTSSRSPISPILLETSTNAHNTPDRQREALFHPIYYSEYIPDPHQPNPTPQPPESYPPPDTVPVANSPSHHIKYFVSINLGAAYSGVSYAISTSDEVHQVLEWPGSSASLSNVPTCLVYDALGHIRAWGIEAQDMSLKKGWVRCEWFKLWLDPSSTPRAVLASRFLQPPQNIVDVVADYLSCLWTHTKSQIYRENGPSSLNHAEVYLTVPSAWDFHASLLLREAAIKARLVVQHSESEDIYWQERLHIIPEAEASVTDSFLSPAFKFQQDQVLTICDAGGATVDLATYKVLRVSGTPKLAEVAPRSGSYCGSLFLDLRFRSLVQQRLAAHPVHLDEASLAHFRRTFSRSEMLNYKGAEDDIKLFRFRCLHGEDMHDPTIGLDRGELVIPGDVLRQEVFDPVVEQVLHSIATHMQASHVPLDALLLVGGFTANVYLFQRIIQQFGSSVASIIRPADGDIASGRCGARFITGSLVCSVIQPQNVFRRVALPAKGEDREMRPAYMTNVAGRWFCERRVEYVVKRGDGVMKGRMSELRLRKFCSSRYDRTFELVLYTSTGDQTWRYFDQEEGEELCRCHIDLRTYPSFLEQVEASPFGNFYVDFVLGFEMDSAGGIIISCLCEICQGTDFNWNVELRCVLVYNGVKCGSVACHPRSYRAPPL